MENSDLVIDGHTATYILPPTQGTHLGTYTGTFKFRCFVTPSEELSAGRDYRALLGPNPHLATENEGNLAYALAHLKYRVISAPPFWNSTLQETQYAGNIPDLNILMIVMQKAFEAEALFKEKLAKEREAVLERSIKAAETLLKEKSE